MFYYDDRRITCLIKVKRDVRHSFNVLDFERCRTEAWHQHFDINDRVSSSQNARKKSREVTAVVAHRRKGRRARGTMEDEIDQFGDAVRMTSASQ